MNPLFGLYVGVDQDLIFHPMQMNGSYGWGFVLGCGSNLPVGFLIHKSFLDQWLYFRRGQHVECFQYHKVDQASIFVYNLEYAINLYFIFS